MDQAWFINSGGSVVPVPAEQIGHVTQLGWIPASPKQIADAQLQEKFGGQAGITALESAGSSLTFGLSTALERGLGVPAENIAGREQANPTASFLGGVGGVLAGLAIPGSAPGLIAKAGKATAALVPEGVSVAGRIAAKAASLGLGSAVEGAAYGAGQVVHEAALGDPNLTAESALASVGLSAMLAGGLGAAGGGVAGLFKEGVKHLPAWLEDVEAHANLQAAGGDKVLARRLREKFGDEGMKDLLLEMRDRGLISGVITTPADVMGRATELAVDSGQKIGNMLTTASQVLPKTIPRAALDDALGVAAKLGENPFEAGTANGLADVLGRYEQKFAVSGGATVKDLHDMEVEFGQQVFGLKGQRNPSLTPQIQALNRIRGTISDAVDKAVTESGAVPEAEWTEANRAFQVAREAQKLAKNGMDRLAGNNPISASALLAGVAGASASGPLAGVASTVGGEVAKRFGSGALSFAARGLRDAIEGPAEEVINKTADAIASQRMAGADTVAAAAKNAPETISALSFLERNNQEIARRIENGAKAVMRGAQDASSTAPAMTATAFNKLSEQYRKLQDPSAMQTLLEKQGAELQEHAPKTAQALQIATARGASFVASQLPQHASSGPMGEAWEPTASELDLFQRKHAVLEDPMVILKHAADGTLTPEEVFTAKAAYPSTLEQMKTALVNEMAKHPEKASAQTRLMLSMLLGQPMDSGMSGLGIMGMQAQYTMPPAMPQGGIRPTSKAMGKIKTGTRMQTDLQRTALRGVK